MGCGKDIRKAWINVDKSDLPGVDLCHDVEDLPLPFDDGSCSEILCKDLLEHLEYPLVLGEIRRILRAGGRVSNRVPHFDLKGRVRRSHPSETVYNPHFHIFRQGQLQTPLFRFFFFEDLQRMHPF